MIVPMKKTTLIAREQDAESAIADLRSLGVLHVEYTLPPQGEGLVALREKAGLLNSCFDAWERSDALKPLPAQEEFPGGWEVLAKHIVELWRRYDQLEAYSRGFEQAIAEWEYWGDFDPREIERLREKGIYARLFQVPSRQAGQFPDGTVARKIFTRGGYAYYLTISFGLCAVSFQEVLPPKQGLSWMRRRLGEDRKLMEKIKQDLVKSAAYQKTLLGIKEKLEKSIEFYQAVYGMGKEGALSYISGYVPLDAAEALEKEAQKRQWGITLDDPSDEDNPPVLLKNPRFLGLIGPVMKLLGVIPGYRELDVSAVFLFFFSVFFGILVGDAGYGMVYLLLTLWFQKKKAASPRNANIFLLLYILNSSAIIWGVLTGTFFGQDWLAGSGIRPLLPALNDPAKMQAFCFFLGALHLTLAHAWRALVKFPSQAFLADLGWIGVLWVSYSLACALILGRHFMSFGLELAALSMLLVLFFSEPRKNLFRRAGAGFTSITFGLGFMSAFTDVVSYVRLFAVGLAGVAIANTTNTMAAGLGSGVAGVSAGILIRVVGHALNMVLAPIAILVHGVRLNVLEFGLNHTGITWSGVPYKPLSEEVS